MNLTRGDTYHRKIQRRKKVVNERGKVTWEPITEKAKEMYFSIKEKYTDDSSKYLVQKSLSKGEIVYNSVTNYYYFTIESKDTKDLQPKKKYYCDIEVTADNGDIHTIFKDELVLDWDVTTGPKAE